MQKAAGGGVYGIRSCFVAPPGRVIIAADYTQAEIATLAYLSGDGSLIEAVEKGLDMHGVVCRQMFKLDCTVEEVKTKHKALRVAAKSIGFFLLRRSASAL